MSPVGGDEREERVKSNLGTETRDSLRLFTTKIHVVKHGFFKFSGISTKS